MDKYGLLPGFYFCFILMWSNVCDIKLITLTILVYSSVTLSTFIILYSYYHNPGLELLFLSDQKFSPLLKCDSKSLCSGPGNHYF